MWFPARTVALAPPIKIFVYSMFLFAWPLLAQVREGELHLKVTDPTGLGLKVWGTVSSESSSYRIHFSTDDEGMAVIKNLAYGTYCIQAERRGFSAAQDSVDVRSALPVEIVLSLAIAPLKTSVEVTDGATTIDPHRPTSVMQIDSAQIESRLSSVPGRSLQDLVNSQPGWLYEGNAVLHPRGSEYQTQFVIDGIPLTDNRSPGSGPEIEADDISDLSIYVAGIPAEYGRKMGGIVELSTRHEAENGLHGQLVLSGGSYDTATSDGRLQNHWGQNTLGASASGGMTAHYLNPVVPENYTNRGTIGDFSLSYQRDMTANDSLSLAVRHELSRYEIPNELIQQQNGQLQTSDNFETIGTINYQHVFSENILGTLAGMVRDNANDLNSNQDSTPIIAFQHNDFREGYFKGLFSFHQSHQEIKYGVESDTSFLHEYFSYLITNSSYFDSDTPLNPPPLVASRPDLEQSAFVEDLIRSGKWTISAGIRYDRYQLLLSEFGFSPRVSVGFDLPHLNTAIHASYDRVFQTPAFENILISSSNQINMLSRLSKQFLDLPVQPSRGNYYEGGLSKRFRDRIRFDVNYYRRDVRNYADDNQLLNTGISYPIAFDKAVIYGAEGKIDLLHLGKLNGFASYSYMVGNVWYPVTGGLFLGDNASAALSQLSGHFPDSQDQRNTFRTRFQYRLMPRVWIAAGASYGSGLPFEYGGDEATALAEYGQQVIDRINFARGRLRPQLAVNASLGADLCARKGHSIRLQADGDNLNNRLNVIDFGGLFSGNSIAPMRSYAARISSNF
ncbi:MAG: TonB-dependent receptor [Terracidiphilus sp.]